MRGRSKNLSTVLYIDNQTGGFVDEHMQIYKNTFINKMKNEEMIKKSRNSKENKKIKVKKETSRN